MLNTGYVVHWIMISVVVMSISCVSAPPAPVSVPRGGDAPDWVRDKDSAYPVTEYLAELGEGDSLRGAKSNAAGAIAQLFKTQITVDSTIRTRYKEITGQDDTILDLTAQTDIDQTIGQSADESLSNLRFGESWQNDMGQVYVIAYLDRAETGNLYRQRILDDDNRVMELLDRSRSQVDALRRYAFVDAALVMAESNMVLVEQLEIINLPMSRSIIHPYDLGNLKAEKADLASELRIKLEVTGDDSDQVEAALSEWVTSRGFSITPDGDMFLTGVVSIIPVELDNKYTNMNWELNLNLLDSNGIPAVSLAHQDRSTGISESAAVSRVYQDMTGMIRKTFDKSFNKYLSSFLEK